jgi:polysaccharide biosynthesis protein PslJ
MEQRPSPADSTTIPTLLGSAATVGLVVLTLSVLSRQAVIVSLGVLGVLILIVLVALPVQVLPAVALGVTVVIPDRVTDYWTSPLVTPGTLVLIVWLVRRVVVRGPAEARVLRGRSRLRNGVLVLSVLLGVLMVPLVVISPTKQISVAWFFTYVIAVLAPQLIPNTEREARLLGRALPWLGFVAAAYAVVQSQLESNPIYTPIYEALGKVDNQHWAVYRADSSFGHPLVAGLFFAVTLAFCVGRWLEARQRRFTVLALVSALGVVSTVSRGSYVAAAVTILALLVIVLLTQSRGRLRLLVVLASLAVGAYLAVNSDAFVERSLSTEAISSFSARSNLPLITLETARAYHWLGGGLGDSQFLAAQFNFQGLPIENSYFQLLIGVGAPGLVLFLGILVLASIAGVRNGNLGACGGLLAYALAISGFAALDSRRGLMLVLGVLIWLCLAKSAGANSASTDLVSAARGKRLGRHKPTSGRLATPRPVPRPVGVSRHHNVSW